MRKKIILGFTTIVIAALVLSSCSKIPQVELDAAKASIEDAKVSGADVYVTPSYLALQDSLNAIMVNVEAQKSKFIKNYTSVKEQLVNLTASAQNVKMQSESRIEELKLEIDKIISEANSINASNKKLILEAPKGKEGASALNEIKSEIEAIEVSINEINAMNVDFMVKLNKATVTKEKTVAINDELKGVIAKCKSRTMKR